MTKHNIWSISIIGLLFALLFTPLIVASSLYFPYVTGKLFAFRIIVSISFILWLVLVLKYPDFLPKKNKIIGVLGIFLLWLAFANATGVDSFNSFFSNFERMEGWFTHVYLFIYLIILSSVLQTEKLWNWFLNVSVIVANIVALNATFDSESRTQIFLGNSTYVAVYILFNLFFVVLLGYRLYKKKTREDALKFIGILYYISSVVLFVYVIFRTQTRGTVLALIFSTILFLILSAISYWKNRNIRIISIALLLLSIGGSFLFWQNRNAAFIQNNPLLVRVATISATEGTGKARLVNWSIALDGIKEKPLLGWGQENYAYVFAQKYNPQMYAQEPWFDRTHNSFLDWSIQGGIPALLLYLLIFGFAVWGIKVSTSLTRVEKNILISLISAYIIHNMFVFDNYSSYLMFFTLLGFIVYHGNDSKIELVQDEKTKQVVVIVLVLACVAASVFTIIRPMGVAQNLIKVIPQKDGNKILDIYQNIFDKKTLGNTEASIRLLSDARPFIMGDDQSLKNRYLELSSKVGSEFENSNDVRRLETYGGFLLQTGNIQKSIEVLEKAQFLAPDRQNNLYTLGMAYINNQEFEKAKEVFKHAYEVLPENQKAKTYYGAVLLLAGDKAGNELIKGYSYKDSLFLAVFARAKQYKEVIKIREQLQKDNPTDYQNQVSLAVMYSLDKQNLKAIQLLREVQKAVPDFKAQGDYLIKEIQAGRSIAK
jgi:O-antigen ligase